MHDPIIVSGGGITGSYVAYLLAKDGHDVILLDPKKLPFSATECNPGGINLHHGPGIPGIMENFHRYCLQGHLKYLDDIQNTSGIDIDFRRIERLFLAFSKEEEKNLLDMKTRYDEARHFEALWCSRKEVSYLDTRIASGVIGGLLTKGNISVDSTLYTEALQTAAKKYGTVILDCSLAELNILKNKVVQIVTDKGENIACSNVVLCTGAWTEEFFKVLNVPISLQAIKGQLLLVRNREEEFGYDITYGLTGMYHFKDDLYWLGGTRENAYPEAGVTKNATKKILEGIAKIIPGFSDFDLLSECAGYRPATEDKIPVAGKIPGFKNIYTGTGGGSKGILHSAGIASLVRESIKQEIPEKYRFLTPERFMR